MCSEWGLKDEEVRIISEALKFNRTLTGLSIGGDEQKREKFNSDEKLNWLRVCAFVVQEY